jgi:hypothetical protein
MTFLQRITHFLGQSIGFHPKDSKLLPKKQKLNPTSLEESNKMLRQTPSQDSVSDLYQAYKEAAESDDFLFGNYDPYKSFEDLEG